jgi:hypothetical protein
VIIASSEKTSNDLDLRATADRINVEHRACEGAGRKTIALAVEVGRLLGEVKSSLPHGAWLPWLKTHCEVSERSAQNYLRVFANRERFTVMVADEVKFAQEVNPHRTEDIDAFMAGVEAAMPGLNGQGERLRAALLQLAAPRKKAAVKRSIPNTPPQAGGFPSPTQAMVRCWYTRLRIGCDSSLRGKRQSLTTASGGT